MFEGPSEWETIVSVELSKLVHSEIFKRRRKCCIPLVFDSARQWPAAHFCVVTGRPAKPRACVLVIEGGEQHTKRAVWEARRWDSSFIGRCASPSPSAYREPASPLGSAMSQRD